MNDILLFFSALLAGGINALAGGGSFLAFPALLFAGVPPINANATCTLALLPGGIGSIWAYRADFDAPRKILLTMSAISFVGGLLGAIIMLKTPPGIFVKLIPYLILSATLIFAFGNRLTGAFLANRLVKGDGAPSVPENMPLGSVLFQLIIAVYGGYFGAGMGIVILAGLSILGMTKIHSMNALKVVLSSIINFIAAVAFVLAGVIYWREVSIMAVGGIIGGILAAKVSQKLPAILVKRLIIGVGLILTVAFFFKS